VDKEYDLLFAGRLIDGKGIFHLLDALKILHPHLPLRVAFAGEGEEKDRLVEVAAKLDLPIKLLGRLDREALILAYRRARVLVVPSSTHTEGNPLVIAEALTCGTPVIASDQGAMVEAIGNAGTTFLRYDAADLARKIEWMFSDDNLSTCTQATKTRLSDFSNETYAERMRDVMHALTRLET
jgi:glycosyltransferase involved in cell wall biosynthesis